MQQTLSLNDLSVGIFLKTSLVVGGKKVIKGACKFQNFDFENDSWNRKFQREKINFEFTKFVSQKTHFKMGCSVHHRCYWNRKSERK